MTFKNLLILILIPILWGLGIWIYRQRKDAAVIYSATSLFAGIHGTWKTWVSKQLFWLRLLVLTLFIVALAAPQSVIEQTEVLSEGIDIILAVDASGSMAAEDFKINGKRANRLSIVKKVVKEFIEQRSGDRIGLVAFAGQAYTVCPLTTDYIWLTDNLDRVDLGLIQEEGTAVGSAVASSLSRLKESEAKSKIIVLLTDGINNAGEIEPLKAADAAAALDVKIYTIGAGTKGTAPYPVNFFGRTVYRDMLIEIDEDTLKEMAQKTDGQYFRATDTESLKEIYNTIDKLEKVEIKQAGYREYNQLFHYVLFVALMLLMLELFLAYWWAVKIP